MTIMKRILNIIFGLLTIVCALLVFALPEIGVHLALAIFTVLFFIYSVRMIVYYIKLARHMVGGQLILFLGVFALCCALFAFDIQDASNVAVSAVLIIILLFMGVVNLFRAIEAKRGGAKSWRFKMTSSVIEIILAVECLVFNAAYPNVIGIIFGIALAYSGVSRIITALRKANWNKIIKNISTLEEE